MARLGRTFTSARTSASKRIARAYAPIASLCAWARPRLRRPAPLRDFVRVGDQGQDAHGNGCKHGEPVELGQPQLGKQCPRAGRHPVVQKAGVSAASPTPGGDNAAACTHAAVMCKRAHAHVMAESLRLPVMCVQRRVPVKRLGRPPLHVSTSPLLHAQLTRRGGAAWHPRQPARTRRWQAAGETCGQRGHCGQHGDGPAALSPVCSLSVPTGFLNVAAKMRSRGRPTLGTPHTAKLRLFSRVLFEGGIRLILAAGRGGKAVPNVNSRLNLEVAN